MKKKQPKLPTNLRGKFVSRASFAKMQAEKQRLEKDIYLMIMGGMTVSYEIRMKWKRKFEKDKQLSDMLREIAKKELPALLEKYSKNIQRPPQDLCEPKIDSNPGAFK